MGVSVPQATAPVSPSEQGELKRISLPLIRPNPFQPRRVFAESDLAELSASLKASGLLQPIIVRPAGDGFELISGERRLRAAGQLGWTEIPALIRAADQRTMLTLALIENLQRADLNVIEEAQGYRRLSEEFQLTHHQIAESVGKERSTVTNLLRLLSIPADVQEMLGQGLLTMGHARALLALPTARAISETAASIVSEGMSVRETERRIRGMASKKKPQSTLKENSPSHSPIVKQIEGELRGRLQTDVHVQMTPENKGMLQIAFYSVDDLNRILDLISGP